MTFLVYNIPVSGNFTGSLSGSASFAQTSTTASYISGSSWLAGGSYVLPSSSQFVSTSYAVTSSYALVAQTLLGSIVSASYALTASYAMNGGGSGVSSSYAATASKLDRPQVLGTMYQNPLSESATVPAGYDFLTKDYVIADGVDFIVSGTHYIL